MAIFSNKKGIRTAKEVTGAQQHTAIKAAEAASAEHARTQAAELSEAKVWGLLGTPGTFGPGSGSSEAWQNVNNVDDPGSLFDTTGLGLSQPDQDLRSYGPNDPAKNSVLGVAREGILDPESYAKSIANTAAFRIQSSRVAESEQLLNREGPAWDMLNNSVLGVINEGSALQLRDTVRKLKNQYAKGGTARRAAVYEAQELAAGESAMRMRVQDTWQANVQLFNDIRQNADRVAAGTQSFMAGLPLVNDSYRDAMQRTAQMQIQAAEIGNRALMGAYDTKMTQQPVNFGENFVEGLVKLVPAAAGALIGGFSGGGGAFSGGGALSGAQAGGLTGALGQMFGGASNAGYTARGSSSGGGGSAGQWGDVFKSGLDYLNTPRAPSYSSDDPRRAGQAAPADSVSKGIGFSSNY